RHTRWPRDWSSDVCSSDLTGGSRSATIGGGAVLMATDKIKTKATAIAAHLLKVSVADVKFEDGIFSSPKTNQTVTIKDVAKIAEIGRASCREREYIWMVGG